MLALYGLTLYVWLFIINLNVLFSFLKRIGIWFLIWSWILYSIKLSSLLLMINGLVFFGNRMKSTESWTSLRFKWESLEDFGRRLRWIGNHWRTSLSFVIVGGYGDLEAWRYNGVNMCTMICFTSLKHNSLSCLWPSKVQTSRAEYSHVGLFMFMFI